MAKQIRNDLDINSIFEPILKEAIIQCSRKISERIHHFILSDVYLYDGSPNKSYFQDKKDFAPKRFSDPEYDSAMGAKTYTRTNKKGEVKTYQSKMASLEFLNAFKWESILPIMNGVARKMFYDGEGMDVSEKYGFHADGSFDLRDGLAEMLNIDGVFGKKQRQPYWDNFIYELFDLGALEEMISEELAKYGFIRIK